MQARATLLAAGKGAAANLSQRYTHRAFPQQKVRPRASRYRMGTQIEASTSVHMADGSLPAALVFDCDVRGLRAPFRTPYGRFRP